MTTFATLLPHVRTKAGLTQNQLADRMGTKRSTIGHIERGANTPTLRTMQRIVTALEPLVDVTPLVETMTPEQTDLAAQVAALTIKLEKMQTRYGAAMSRNELLRRELAERGLETTTTPYSMVPDERSATAESENEPFPTIDPELVALRRLIAALRERDHETFAPAICWALNQVKTITQGLKEATGNVRGKGRIAA